MKRCFFILLFVIVNSLYVNANFFTTVLFDSSYISTLHKDSVNTDILLKENVDTVGLAGNLSKEKSHGISKNAGVLNIKSSSSMKRNNSLKKIHKKAPSDLKNKVSYNSSQDFNVAVGGAIDSLKRSIESMRQTNDSILTISQEFSNKLEKTFKLYRIVFFLLGIGAIFSIIILIKKYRKIITYKVKELTDVTSKLQSCISLLIEENKSMSIGIVQNCTKEMTKISDLVNQIGISLKAMDEKIDVGLTKINNMPIVQPEEISSPSKNIVEKKGFDSVIEAEDGPQITEVQYNDAISEFERINNRLFKLRKYKTYSQELLRFLFIGEMNKEEYIKRLGESDLPEDGKEHLNTILYDIERFNTQRRELISNYISQQKLTCFDIRFPLLEGFDDKRDHHFKGDDVVDGEKIIRVCKLGYYFPNSHVAPYRVKCEVDTEKGE